MAVKAPPLELEMSPSGQQVILRVYRQVQLQLDWREAQAAGRALRRMGKQAQDEYYKKHPKLNKTGPLETPPEHCSECGTDFLTDHYDGCTMSSRTRSI